MRLGSITYPRARFTSPVGRGRRGAPGEGLRSLVREEPLTRFAPQIDLSPPGRGEANARTNRFNQRPSRSRPPAPHQFKTIMLRKQKRGRKAPSQSIVFRACYLILDSRNSTCLRATGSYFFLTNLSVMVLEFFLA